MSLSSSQKKDKFKKKIEKFLHSKKNLRLEIQELLELETANSLLQAKQVSEEIAWVQVDTQEHQDLKEVLMEQEVIAQLVVEHLEPLDHLLLMDHPELLDIQQAALDKH